MILGVNFFMYMSNVILPGVPVIQNVTNAIGCSLQTKLANGTSFFYDRITKTCLVHLQTPFADTGLIPKPGSKYYVSRDRYVKSCAEVKLCSPDYSVDKEYWLYPAIYNHRAVKIYCKGMNTPTPSEYLTLPTPNIFTAAKIRYRDRSCQVEPFSNAAVGETQYSKIGIDITTMTIFENDSNFTSQGFGALMKYGWVKACSGYTPPCVYRGMSVLNIYNTGLIFSELNEWMTFGVNGGFSVQQGTNYEIQLTGDGNCGGGRPKYPLKLEINPLYKPPHYSAIEPVCV